MEEDSINVTLKAFKIYEHPAVDAFAIVPAHKHRGWMDESPNRFAYRCLPLDIANQMGWFILCPADFSAVWDGGMAPESIQISFLNEMDAHTFKSYILAHFGQGILTFSLPYLFQTSPGYGLMVRGPTNYFVPGASALDGYVETEWLDFTFTMNWKLTDPGRAVHFKKGEPICMIFPYAVQVIEDISPKLATLTDESKLHARFEKKSQSRKSFNADPERGTNWQRDYFQGKTADEQPAPAHRTKLNVRPFKK